MTFLQMRFLEKYQEHTYAAFRAVIGFLFIFHGTMKFFDFPAEYPYGPLSPLSISAASIEIVAGTLVMIGLFTRPAAFIASGTMAVAYWLAHGLKDLFPINNGGELAILFCFGFLMIAAKGAGIWSLDKR